MSIKETIKSKTLSIAAFAVVTITTALLINALMITTNAQENNPKKKPSGDSSQRKTTGGQPSTERNANGPSKTRGEINNSESSVFTAGKLLSGFKISPCLISVVG